MVSRQWCTKLYNIAHEKFMESGQEICVKLPIRGLNLSSSDMNRYLWKFKSYQI